MKQVMFSLSYTISDSIKNELTLCETLRRQILLTPLNPGLEFRLRWQAKVNRIQDLLNFLGFTTSKSEILTILSATRVNSTPSKSILMFRDLDSYLFNTWTANVKPFTLETLTALIELIPPPSFKIILNYLRRIDKSMDKLFHYVQSTPEPAVLSSGIVQAQTTILTNSEPEGLLLGRLLSYIFLLRGGYDLRGMLILGTGQKKELGTFLEILSQANARGNATDYLVWYAHQISLELTRLKDAIVSVHSLPAVLPPLLDSFWALNRRQEEVLRLLDNPKVKITNRDIQRKFKVSQITASRDLARLASLGLIYPHGKGRSVFYTKI